jgi:hypothetical protein
MRVRLLESVSFAGASSCQVFDMDGRPLQFPERQTLSEDAKRRIRKMLLEIEEMDRQRLEMERRRQRQKEAMARVPVDPESVIRFLRSGR